MKITEETVTKLTISEIERLDPVNVIIDDIGKGRGRIILECFGKSWTVFWPAMGEADVSTFFCDCENDYILGKMLENTNQTDFDKINEIARKKGIDLCVATDVEVAMSSSDMSECFGDEWYMDLPQCKTSDYGYLSRIIDAVKKALNSKSN